MRGLRELVANLEYMIPAFLSTGFAGVIALLIGMASMSVTFRLWRGQEHVGIAFGVLGIGLGSFVEFVLTWLSPQIGPYLSIALILGSIVVLVLGKAWRHWRQALPPVLLTIGLVLFSLSILYLWDSPTGAFSMAETRFVGGLLPSDNYIPFVFSERLAHGESTHLLFGDWNGSDRPPLQAGFLLLIRAVAAPIAGGTSGAFGASIIAQALWVPGLFALLRAIGASRAGAILGTIMAGATGTVVVNSVFTWPKLMSAALVLCSCVFLIDAARRPRKYFVGMVAAVVAFVLAVLAHGTAAFALPLVLVLGVVAWRRRGLKAGGMGALVALVAGSIVYFPWVLYQRFADPPGDRLLKWHLAGVVSRNDQRSFVEALADSLHAKGVASWLSDRISNLHTVFDPNLFAGFNCSCGDIAARRQVSEFSITTVALVFALPALLGVLAAIVVRLWRKRSIRPADHWLIVLFSGSLASIIFWCLVMFTPGSTVIHQGSLAWILLFLSIPIAWLFSQRRWLAWVAVGLQAIEMLFVYLPTERAAPLQPMAVILALVSFAAIATGVALVSARRTNAPAERGLESRQQSLG